jgi:hypothetical protein
MSSCMDLSDSSLLLGVRTGDENGYQNACVELRIVISETTWGNILTVFLSSVVI